VAKQNIELRNTLASIYWKTDQARRIVIEAGLNPIYIPFDEMPIQNWFGILNYADLQGAVQKLAAVAHQENPNNQTLAAAAQGQLHVIEPLTLDRRDWKGLTDSGKLEEVLGAEDTLLPIHFFEQGLLAARSVVKVVRANGDAGTGFLTENNLLITNHHVLPSSDIAAAARIECNYQESMDGLAQPKEEYKLLPADGFATSPAEGGDDWTAVRVAGNPQATWGALPLQPVEVKQNERVVIIQHAGGGPKQIAFYHNVVAYVGQARVQYFTDTKEGSSGAPVFNHRWQVVALHHKGGVLLPVGANKMTKGNQGIQIGVVLAGVKAAKLL
jgi:hypothetical protein